MGGSRPRSARLKRMNGPSILDKTMQEIHRVKDLRGLRIEEIYLRSYFTVLTLCDGSIGSAGNYDVQGPLTGTAKYDPSSVERDLLEKVEEDPLLLHHLTGRNELFETSLYVSVVSALSQELLSPSYLRDYGLRIRKMDGWGAMLRKLTRANDTVTLIGFGGGLTVFLRSRVKRLYVSDLAFQDEATLAFAVRELEKLITQHAFEGEVVLTDSENIGSTIADSDLVFITGSALCNETMEGLLDHSMGCREIIVQGPSASIFPVELFNRKVTHLFTTVKTEEERILGRLSGSPILRVVDNRYVHVHSK